MQIKRFGNLKKPYRIAISVVSAILVVILTLVFVMLAVIETHRTYVFGYTGYTGTQLIAHRGYSGKYFDNTLPAFEAAAAEPRFHGIETDIRLTSDGVWVCSHDDKPFVDKSVSISNSTYDEIKDLPLDTSKAADGVITEIDYRLATYEEYLDVCRRSRKIALIEIKKSYSEEELTEAVNAAIDSLYYNNVYFGSFRLKAIENVQKINPYVRVLLFTDQSVAAYCLNSMGFGIGVNKKILNEKKISRARDNGTPIFSYTVKTEEEYRRMYEMTVDFVISNYPY